MLLVHVLRDCSGLRRAGAEQQRAINTSSCAETDFTVQCYGYRGYGKGKAAGVLNYHPLFC